MFPKMIYYCHFLYLWFEMIPKTIFYSLFLYLWFNLLPTTISHGYLFDFWLGLIIFNSLIKFYFQLIVSLLYLLMDFNSFLLRTFRSKSCFGWYNGWGNSFWHITLQEFIIWFLFMYFSRWVPWWTCLFYRTLLWCLYQFSWWIGPEWTIFEVIIIWSLTLMFLFLDAISKLLFHIPFSLMFSFWSDYIFILCIITSRCH